MGPRGRDESFTFDDLRFWDLIDEMTRPVQCRSGQFRKRLWTLSFWFLFLKVDPSKTKAWCGGNGISSCSQSTASFADIKLLMVWLQIRMVYSWWTRNMPGQIKAWRNIWQQHEQHIQMNIFTSCACWTLLFKIVLLGWSHSNWLPRKPPVTVPWDDQRSGHRSQGLSPTGAGNSIRVDLFIAIKSIWSRFDCQITRRLMFRPRKYGSIHMVPHDHHYHR